MKVTAEMIGTCSRRGNSKKHNMDHAAFRVFPDDNAAVLVVADGMGGTPSGEVASELAGTAITTWFADRGFKTPAATLREAVAAANSRILDEGSADARKRGMASTVVVALVVNGELFVAHAGDSRAAIYRGAYVRRLTKDHLTILETGVVTDETKAKNHKRANEVSRGLGIGPDPNPAMCEFPLESGDVIFLCTDGITSYATEDVIAKFIHKHSPADAAIKIVEHAVGAGSPDHCTALVAKLG